MAQRKTARTEKKSAPPFTWKDVKREALRQEIAELESKLQKRGNNRDVPDRGDSVQQLREELRRLKSSIPTGPEQPVEKSTLPTSSKDRATQSKFSQYLRPMIKEVRELSKPLNETDEEEESDWARKNPALKESFDAHYKELNERVQSIWHTWIEVFESSVDAHEEHMRGSLLTPLKTARELHEKRGGRRKTFSSLEQRVTAANEAWQSVRRKEREFQAAHKNKPRKSGFY